MVSENKSKSLLRYGKISIALPFIQLFSLLLLTLLFESVPFSSDLDNSGAQILYFPIVFLISPILSIIGLIIGIVGIRFTKKSEGRKANTLSIIGVIINSLSIIFVIAGVIFTYCMYRKLLIPVGQGMW